jgi:protein involved in polysaccharide export with SLBB domain
MTTKSQYLVLVAAAALLSLASGCGSFRGSGPAREARDGALAEMAAVEKATGPRQQPSLDAAARARASAGREPVIQAGHVLLVRVMSRNRVEIKEEALRVSGAGKVTLPLHGDVKVEGLTRETCKALLSAIYAEYIRNPAVIVDFVAPANGREPGSPWGYVTVLGCVKQPGNVNIPATGNLTVTAAIQECGGLGVGARHADVQVVQRAEDGKSETRRVDLHKVDKNGRPAGEIPLRNGDVVFVPEGLF